MKTFLEWVRQNDLLNELSPDTYHSAADNALKMYQRNNDDLHAKARVEKFRKAGYDAYKFPITLKDAQNGKILQLQVLRIKWLGLRLFLKTDKGDFQIDPYRGTITSDFTVQGTTLKAGMNTTRFYSITVESARTLIDRVNKQFGQKFAYSVLPRMPQGQDQIPPTSGENAQQNDSGTNANSATQEDDRRKKLGFFGRAKEDIFGR